MAFSRKVIKATGWYGEIDLALDNALVAAYEQGYSEGTTQLKEQNKVLQALNTKLTLRVRELEQDGKRLDWLETKFHETTYFPMDTVGCSNVRQAIDKAMEGE